jgi:epoxyqueuosine reductase
MEIDFTQGERYRFVDARHLSALKADIERFRDTQELNGFQSWIVREMYEYGPSEPGFKIESVLIIAVPHPLYANVTLTHGGAAIRCQGLVSPNLDETRRAITQACQRFGRTAIDSGNLPLKRLAVQCGLASYGRNNVTYVDGMGSCLSYIAFYTDESAPDSPWRETATHPACASCTVCLKTCPTGAIRSDRFLIDNQRCLSALNEVGDAFPDWLSPAVHHTLYDCLRCQAICPLNREVPGLVGEDVHFDESETALLLSAVPMDRYPEAMRAKGRYLGLDRWTDGIAKNVRALIEREGAARG